MKIIKRLLSIVLIVTIFTFSNVLAESNEFCIDTSEIWRYVGYFLLVIKIIIPIIIIVMGIFDFAKAVTSSDEKALGKAASSLGQRIVMGVAIFFVPTIISFIFSLIGAAAPQIKEVAPCKDCLLRPLSDDCKGYINEAKEIRNNRN